MNDPYKILGVAPTASTAEIRRAYRDLAKKYHPDVSRSADASRRMQEVNDAYAAVGDPIKRAEYDQMQQMRAAQPPQTPEPSAPPKTTVCCSRCGKVDASLRVATFTTVWSVIVLSFRKSWANILCTRCRTITSLRYNLQVLVFGWWGIPWGPIWSAIAIIKNSAGGHQPRENNAILLAIVGQNLINLGEYAEAEKALTASLRLKEDPLVIQLLQIAKSKSGYIRPESASKKIVQGEGHPVIYNAVLILVFCAAVYWLAQPANSFRPRSTAQASTATTDTTPSVARTVAPRTNPSRDEQWGLPIRIGDSRQHVYEVLGSPKADKQTQAVQETSKLMAPTEDTQNWDNMQVTFKHDQVLEITPGDGAKNMFYGISQGDTSDTVTAHLGAPSKIDTKWETWKWNVDNYTVGMFEMVNAKTNAPMFITYIRDRKPEIEAEEASAIEAQRIALTGQPLTPQQIYEKYKNRIYVVTALDSQDQPVALGTGFLFADHAIVTNYHVVQDARKIMVQKADKSEPAVETHMVNANGGWTELLGEKNNDWVVLIKFNRDDPELTPSLPPVLTNDSTQPGEQVTVIGNPEGLTASVTTGVLSAQRDDGWIQISAPISHGSSGSPVFDSTGHWIGLATAMLSDGQNLNFATPSSRIVAKATDTDKDNPYNVLPLHQIWQDPLYAPMVRRENKTDAEARQSIADINTLLGEYTDPKDQNDLLSDLETISTDTYHDYNTALKLATKRTQLQPHDYRTWQAQGMLYGIKLNDPADGRVSLLKAIELASAPIQKDFDDHQKEYDHEEDLDNHESESQVRHAQEKATADNYTKSAHCGDAVEIGRMYMIIGDRDNALAWLTKARDWSSVVPSPGMNQLVDLPEANRLLGILQQAQSQNPTTSAPAPAQ